MQFLLIISASFFLCAFLHVFCIILPYFGNFEGFRKILIIGKCVCRHYSAYNGMVQYQNKVNPSHAAIKISINATAAEFICKNIFPPPVQIKKI